MIPALLVISLIGCSDNRLHLSDNSVREINLEIRQSFDRLVEASKKLDSKRYFEFFDKDKFVGLNSDGKNWNSIDDLRKIVEPGFNAVDRVQFLVFTNIQVSVIDKNTAILVNEYEQEVVLKSGEVIDAAGGGTQVWSRESGEWKIVSVSSSIKPSRTNE